MRYRAGRADSWSSVAEAWTGDPSAWLQLLSLNRATRPLGVGQIVAIPHEWPPSPVYPHGLVGVGQDEEEEEPPPPPPGGALTLCAEDEEFDWSSFSCVKVEKLEPITPGVIPPADLFCAAGYFPLKNAAGEWECTFVGCPEAELPNGTKIQMTFDPSMNFGKGGCVMPDQEDMCLPGLEKWNPSTKKCELIDPTGCTPNYEAYDPGTKKCQPIDPPDGFACPDGWVWDKTATWDPQFGRCVTVKGAKPTCPKPEQAGFPASYTSSAFYLEKGPDGAGWYCAYCLPGQTGQAVGDSSWSCVTPTAKTPPKVPPPKVPPPEVTPPEVPPKTAGMGWLLWALGATAVGAVAVIAMTRGRGTAGGRGRASRGRPNPTEPTPREEILSKYNVDRGRIRSPGKFEGEMLYVPHFWTLALEGLADSDDGRVFGFRITAEDRAIFPELGKRKRWVRLYERDDGFVVEL